MGIQTGKRLLAVGLTAVLLCTTHVEFRAAAVVPAVDKAFTGYFDAWTAVDEEQVVWSSSESAGLPLHLEVGEAREIPVSVPETGRYTLLLDYRADSSVLLKSTLQVSIGETGCRTQVFSLWEDVSKNYRTDAFGNEMPAEQRVYDASIVDFVQDQASVSRRPAVFELAAGEHTLTLTSDDVPLSVQRIRVVRENEPPSYAAYAKTLSGKAPGTDFVVIEGEDYTVKSDSYIRAGAERNPALYPYDYRVKRLNILDASSFDTVGQKVVYGFEIKQAGVYHISLRYSQNYKEDIPVFQNVQIDGRSLFDEMRSMPFAYTGVAFQNTTLTAADGAAGVYLDAGWHTISLEADGTPVAAYVERLQAILSDLSSIGLEIKKISGTGASEYRTWDVESYMPGVVEKLRGYREELLELYEGLGTLQTKNPAAALNIKLAADNLQKLLKNPDKLFANLSLLSEGSGSAAQYLSDQIDKLTYQNLAVDRLYIHGSDETLPAAKAGFFTKISDGIKRFFHALFYNEEIQAEDDVLRVWINRPIFYMETLQSLADTLFTPETGIRVQFSLMPSEQRIILSNATNTSPDVIMGVQSNMPFDLGLRNAAVDLTQFPDFASYMQKEYNPESLVPYTLGEQVFGVTETQEFYVLMYRRDILERLGLKIPETWDDVADMMPTLRRNSMDFYLQLSGYSGAKPLYTTVPFLQQAGADLYSADGLTTAINSKEGLRGFETLTNLYKLYSLPQTVSSFYNSFRYGQIPIGIGSFTDYVKIKNAAPEIAGLWDIALAPGMRDDEGRIHRGTVCASTACALLSQSQMQEEGWEFLKWWLSKEVQTTFGSMLQTTYGPDYLWNTANLEAFRELTFPEADKAVILEQWDVMREIPRHPALYAVERELSNAWIGTVLGGKSARIALDDAVLIINREFERKLSEFGYTDRDGQILKPYVFYPIEDILQKGGRSS